MPGRFYLTRPAVEIADWFGAEQGGIDAPPRRNVSPGQDVLTCTPGRRLVPMRWGMIPVGRTNARGRPVLETIVNARSETVFDKSAFAEVGRALVPADGWYEWTGKAGRKKAWRIKPVDGSLLAFAAITDRWTAPGGKVVHQVATITCDPSADVKDIHHRMGVLLTPDQFDTWLDSPADIARHLLRPFPDGSLVVEPAHDVDWSAP